MWHTWHVAHCVPGTWKHLKKLIFVNVVTIEMGACPSGLEAYNSADPK